MTDPTPTPCLNGSVLLHVHSTILSSLAQGLAMSDYPEQCPAVTGELQHQNPSQRGVLWIQRPQEPEEP